MKLWLLKQNINNDWDTYDSVVVAALTKEEAVTINPGGFREWNAEQKSWEFIYADGDRRLDKDTTWVLPKDIECTYLGEAGPAQKVGIVCASFNAG